MTEDDLVHDLVGVLPDFFDRAVDQLLERQRAYLFGRDRHGPVYSMHKELLVREIGTGRRAGLVDSNHRPEALPTELRPLPCPHFSKILFEAYHTHIYFQVLSSGLEPEHPGFQSDALTIELRGHVGTSAFEVGSRPL